jgi:hypothetical protein
MQDRDVGLLDGQREAAERDAEHAAAAAAAVTAAAEEEVSSSRAAEDEAEGGEGSREKYWAQRIAETSPAELRALDDEGRVVRLPPSLHARSFCA